LDPGNFGRCVSKIAEKAEIGHWSIHELRHSCASLIISTGVPLESVSDQLGHVSIGITKSIYVHLLPGSGARAAKAMEDLLYADHGQIESSEQDSVARRSARHSSHNS
jgi:integrase